MIDEQDRILLAHGGGGILTRKLIVETILPKFQNDLLNPLNDSAVFSLGTHRIAFTTDGFVVKPIFFQGGDIGKLSICGTINDLAVMGAKPLYLSCAFILEEGFPLKDFQSILQSMKDTADDSGVILVAGDTKVVERNAAQDIFITTTGIGIIEKNIRITSQNAKSGDIVIINGPIGDHGISVLSQREGIKFQTTVQSDVASLHHLIQGLLEITHDIHCMRDPTRGGLAAALNEIASSSGVGMRIREDRIPIRNSVRGACDMLGLDPLHVANEGKVIIICPKIYQDNIIKYLRSHPLGKESSVIGEIVDKPKDTVIMETSIGGERIVDIPYGEDLPRIC